ncbi:hypothetical protein F5I97DRAFT_1809631, partial [Phlebopus sp. FC_14]
VSEQRKVISALESENGALQTSLRQLEDIRADAELNAKSLQEERSRCTSLENKLSQVKQAAASATAHLEQTISLLVSEKASLTASVQRLEGVDIELQEKETLFRSETEKSQYLSRRVRELEANAIQQRNELQEVLLREKGLSERCRDQEREIQLRRAELDELQDTSAQYQQKVRELEEQIESDDRADLLEVSLKNTQDRADELEFQLTKLKQVHASLKTEKEDIESELSLRADGEAEWKTKHSNLEEQHVALQSHLQSANARQSELTEERASLQSQVEFNQSAVKQLQQKLGELASEVSSGDRMVHNLQGELRAALRRAEASEKTQRDLQAEGTRLMQSLEEMRPKIVELTAVKVELMEQIEKLEHDKTSRDRLISNLEITVSEATEREAEAAERQREVDVRRDKETHSLRQTIADLQRGYALLESELQSSQAAVQTLEAERTRMRQAEIRQIDLGNTLAAESRRWEEEIAQLQSELASLRRTEAEQRNLISHYSGEIEALQSDLEAKEEELEHTQKTPVTEDTTCSLDHEMLNASRQQHDMELSSAQSQIRALEAAVFEAEDKVHRLQRHVNILEDQLSHSRSASRATFRPFSPGAPARPSSRTSSDLRRGSFSHKSSGLVPPTRSVFDVGLSPETRHNRQVSLSMLKARIDSEAAANSHSLPRGLSPVPQGNEASLKADGVHPPRPQFMDESHIFWCHSCHGDLVIL